MYEYGDEYGDDPDYGSDDEASMENDDGEGFGGDLMGEEDVGDGGSGGSEEESDGGSEDESGEPSLEHGEAYEEYERCLKAPSPLYGKLKTMLKILQLFLHMLLMHILYLETRRPCRYFFF